MHIATTVQKIRACLRFCSIHYRLSVRGEAVSCKEAKAQVIISVAVKKFMYGSYDGVFQRIYLSL